MPVSIYDGHKGANSFSESYKEYLTIRTQIDNILTDRQQIVTMTSI
jgi:hypothetical protein